MKLKVEVCNIIRIWTEHKWSKCDSYSINIGYIIE